MQPFIIRDPARVRSYVIVLALSLVLLIGWAVVRQFTGPDDQVPFALYGVVGAVVVVWNVTGILSRSDLVRVDKRGISSGRDRFGWDRIRGAKAARGELVLQVDTRRVLTVPKGREADINAAIAAHRPGRASGTSGRSGGRR